MEPLPKSEAVAIAAGAPAVGDVVGTSVSGRRRQHFANHVPRPLIVGHLVRQVKGLLVLLNAVLVPIKRGSASTNSLYPRAS